MAFMLLRATKLRTPVHGSPFAPRAFCMSQECSSGSVLNSQWAGPDLGGGVSADADLAAVLAFLAMSAGSSIPARHHARARAGFCVSRQQGGEERAGNQAF